MLELIEVVDVQAVEPPREPICRDKDEDCDDMESHLRCWMLDMGQGRCPYITKDDDK